MPVLRRQLGVLAIAAVVSGDMFGSGIFFTPGELARITTQPWQIYFFWTLAGLITLCGALSLAELGSLVPESGATFHIIREAFGDFWAFLKIWVELLVSGPGSVAGIAILFGDFFSALFPSSFFIPVIWGALAIVFFAIINLLGVTWGARTQIVLTATKILAMFALVAGSYFLAVPAEQTNPAGAIQGPGFLGFLRFIGLGVAAVLFTYDGWIDVTHVAGEVRDPKKNLSRGLIAGVLLILALYLMVNHAFLRVVPIEYMRQQPTLIANFAAEKAFGTHGAILLRVLILISVFGTLGGLVMTLPRLYFGAAMHYEKRLNGNNLPHFLFHQLARVSTTRSVPAASILFCSFISILVLFFLGTFGKIITFFVVPLQFVNIMMVASIYRLRKRSQASSDTYLTPGYPFVPAIFIFVMGLFLVSAIFFNPKNTLIGIALACTALPVYKWVVKYELRSQDSIRQSEKGADAPAR